MCLKRQFIYAVLLIISFLYLHSCNFFYNLTYPTATIEIINEAELEILEVYIVLQSEHNWGENRISSPLAPGDSVFIESVEKDIVKIKIIFDNYIEEIIEEIDLTSTEIYKLKILPSI